MSYPNEPLLTGIFSGMICENIPQVRAKKKHRGISTVKCTHWQLNDREVSSEVIEGELIVMHLKTGKYYSSSGTGPLVWACLEAGMSAAATRDFVASCCRVSPQSIESDIDGFIESVAAEQLMRESTAEVDPVPPPCTDPPVYSKPVLQVYSDMKDLLLLDPIHDVSEDGWPKRPTADKA